MNNKFTKDRIYMIDGETLNNLHKVCEYLKGCRPEHKDLINKLIQDLLQCSTFDFEDDSEWDSIDEYEFAKMLHHIGITPYSERN